jgi:hypothetical protein
MSLLAQGTLLEDLAGQARILAATGFAAAVLCFGTLFIYGKFTSTRKPRRTAARRAVAPVAVPVAPLVPVSAPEIPAPAAVPVASAPCPTDVRSLLRNPATRRAAFIAAEILAPPPALRR